MKVTREEAAASRERILDGAARLFRERGLHGIGVADLMRDAGLTHGAFYGHFDSKEALMGAACERAMQGSMGRWERIAASGRGSVMKRIAAAYLSLRHRDAPGSGCPAAALAADVARQGGAARRSFTDGLREQLRWLASATLGRTAAARRKRALVDYSTLVGALVLARAVDDPALSEEILVAARTVFH